MRSDDGAILAERERGEDAAVALYRKALEAPDLPNGLREILTRQYEMIQASHDRMRSLRDARHERR